MGVSVGIMTFQRAINYGAVLQAYALNRKLNEMGFACETLDYICNAVETQYQYRTWRESSSWKNFIAHNLTCFAHREKKRKMIEFRKRIPQSISCNNENIERIASPYNILITGSDQVFNPICHQDDSAYYLEFAKNQKKYAYAASLGSIEAYRKSKLDTKRLLSDFDALSFREADSAEYMSKTLVRNCPEMPDPVWLLSGRAWSEIAKKTEHEKYIFVYNLMDYPYMRRFVRMLHRKTGYRVIAASRTIMGDAMYAAMAKTASNCSPEEFLGYIRNAEYVVTDSFHGTSFSMMFQRPFFAALNPSAQNTNTRISTMLKKTGLKDRLINRDSVPQLEMDVDWTRVEETMRLSIIDAVRFFEEMKGQ